MDSKIQNTITQIPYNNDSIESFANNQHSSTNLVSTEDKLNYLNDRFNCIKLNGYIYDKNQCQFRYLNGSYEKPDNDWLYIYLVFDELRLDKEFRVFIQYRYAKKYALGERTTKCSRIDKIAFGYNEFKEFKRLAETMVFEDEDDSTELTSVNPLDEYSRTTGIYQFVNLIIIKLHFYILLAPTDDKIHHDLVGDLIAFNSKD